MDLSSFQERQQKTLQTRLRYLRSEASTAVGASDFENTPEPTPYAASASLPPSFLRSSGSASLDYFTRLRPQILAPVIEVSRNDYVEAQEIS